jgi:hypothetical protein
VQQVPPPHGSTLRVSRHPQAHFHLGAAVRAARLRPTAPCVWTPRAGPSPWMP